MRWDSFELYKVADNRRHFIVERVPSVFICPLEYLRERGGHGLQDISPKFVYVQSGFLLNGEKYKNIYDFLTKRPLSNHSYSKC